MKKNPLFFKRASAAMLISSVVLGCACKADGTAVTESFVTEASETSAVIKETAETEITYSFPAATEYETSGYHSENYNRLPTVNVLVDNSFAYMTRRTRWYGDFAEQFNVVQDEYYCNVMELGGRNGDIVSEIIAAVSSDDPPDIILCADHYYFLDDGDLMADLDPFVKFQRHELFWHAVDGMRSEQDGKLYFLPIDLCIQMIRHTDGSDKVIDTTYDEYLKYVAERRFDPMMAAITTNVREQKQQYLEYIMENQMDLFLKDGKFDCTNDDFYDMIRYLDQNNYGVYTQLYSDTIGEPDALVYISHPWYVPFGQTYDPTSHFIRDDVNNGYGLPSSDGRGPAIFPSEGIMVTKGSEDKPEVKAFLDYVLGVKGVRAFSDAGFTVVRDYEGFYGQMCAGFGWEGITPAYYEFFDEYVDNTRVEAAHDRKIVEIVKEETKDYLDGNLKGESIEDIAVRIENKVNALIEYREDIK